MIHSNGLASLPAYAPISVHNAIQAANQIAGKPYVYGGGHRKLYDRGYDCSGSVSYVLNHAGLLRGCGTSDAFRRYGQSGKGEWITVYAKDGHTFLEIAGLRFDTGGHGSNSSRGPHWSTSSRPLSGFRARHPIGL
ncbi:MAG: C40 family peptidase [Verrucomicrobiaceae bacterium]|nr:C40 family peptidase [Verrucomicrobiaceae bacterium]